MAATEYQCLVKFFRMLTPTVFEIGFEPNQPFEFKAGQFISVVVPGAGPKGRDLRRAYSIASAPHVRPVELCVKLVDEGPGTNYLYKLREGDTFRGFAPYGDFIYRTPSTRHACFISTGTGIAPFRAMAMSQAYQSAAPVSATCLFGVRHEEELLYLNDLATLSGLNWAAAVSQPKGDWKGFKGRVTDWLRARGPEFPWKETDYYLCGSNAMITEIKAILGEHGVEKDAIHQEKYY